MPTSIDRYHTPPRWPTTRMLPLMGGLLGGCLSQTVLEDVDGADAWRSVPLDDASAVAITEAFAQELSTFDADASLDDRNGTPPLLTQADVDEVINPGRDVEGLEAFWVTHFSEHPIDRHVDHYILIEDVTPVSPTATSYIRTIIDGDADAFRGGDGSQITVRNDIERRALFFDFSYEFLKTYRWVTLTDGTEAIISRGWLPESVSGEQGANVLHQTYEAEMWIPEGTGTRRYYVQWTEAEYSVLSTTAARNLTLRTGADGMVDLDIYISERENER